MGSDGETRADARQSLSFSFSFSFSRVTDRITPIRENENEYENENDRNRHGAAVPLYRLSDRFPMLDTELLRATVLTIRSLLQVNEKHREIRPAERTLAL